MQKICLWLARFFDRVAKWVGPSTTFGYPIQPVDAMPALHQRMRDLLSRDDLAEEEEAELANIIKQFNGRVIVLPSKERL